MVTRIKYDGVLEFHGLSSERAATAPSLPEPDPVFFIEDDTGKKYHYDKENSQWTEVPNSGGGGGGGGGEGYTTYTKTFSTISAMRLSDDERTILLGTLAKIQFNPGGDQTLAVSGILKDDGALGIFEVTWWLLFATYFGIISVGADMCSQMISVTVLGSTTTQSVDVSGYTNVELMFYVTPEQKAQLEALNG